MIEEHHALLQKDLNWPAQEALARAFQSSGVLTAFDAQTMRRDAFGILVSKLSREKAVKLADYLAREGVETDVVRQVELPALAAPKTLRQLDCLPEACRIYDPLGRPFDVDWAHIQLVTSGLFKTLQTRRQAVEQSVLIKPLTGSSQNLNTVEYRTREEWVGTPVVELILSGAVIRYTFNPRSFRYDYLQDRKKPTADENWVTLMKDLRVRAKAAYFNRGALGMLGEPPQPMEYPSENAFEEESVWLLWKAGVRGQKV